jgi:hypothetical protein
MQIAAPLFGRLIARPELSLAPPVRNSYRIG